MFARSIMDIEVFDPDDYHRIDSGNNDPWETIPACLHSLQTHAAIQE